MNAGSQCTCSVVASPQQITQISMQSNMYVIGSIEFLKLNLCTTQKELNVWVEMHDMCTHMSPEVGDAIFLGISFVERCKVKWKVHQAIVWNACKYMYIPFHLPGQNSFHIYYLIVVSIWQINAACINEGSILGWCL